MPRKNGIDSHKLCWRITIKQGDIILHNKDYTTLKVAAGDLGLTYAQLIELKPNGRNQKKKIAFKFYPEIKIKKLCYENKLIDHIQENKENEKINNNN